MSVQSAYLSKYLSDRSKCLSSATRTICLAIYFVYPEDPTVGLPFYCRLFVQTVWLVTYAVCRATDILVCYPNCLSDYLDRLPDCLHRTPGHFSVHLTVFTHRPAIYTVICVPTRFVWLSEQLVRQSAEPFQLSLSGSVKLPLVRELSLAGRLYLFRIDSRWMENIIPE